MQREGHSEHALSEIGSGIARCVHARARGEYKGLESYMLQEKQVAV